MRSVCQPRNLQVNTNCDTCDDKKLTFNDLTRRSGMGTWPGREEDGGSFVPAGRYGPGWMVSRDEWRLLCAGKALENET